MRIISPSLLPEVGGAGDPWSLLAPFIVRESERKGWNVLESRRIKALANTSPFGEFMHAFPIGFLLAIEKRVFVLGPHLRLQRHFRLPSRYGFRRRGFARGGG